MSLSPGRFAFVPEIEEPRLWVLIDGGHPHLGVEFVVQGILLLEDRIRLRINSRRDPLGLLGRQPNYGFQIIPAENR